ncbi:unnamed protein product [Rangifer tarandus platyrhynchus]|uniref:Uncharacterized protein n=1 Tax=Rangifer tarandus platyrhynchus TaxID=3082113 RepID=A0AC59YB23_RANTA
MHSQHLLSFPERKQTHWCDSWHQSWDLDCLTEDSLPRKAPPQAPESDVEAEDPVPPSSICFRGHAHVEARTPPAAGGSGTQSRLAVVCPCITSLLTHDTYAETSRPVIHIPRSYTTSY